ncbi:cellulose binding domain-containing protein [Actinoplanes sp. NPDC000266]
MTEDRRPRHGAPDYRADVRQNPGSDDAFSAFPAAPPADAETTRFEAPRPSFDPSWPPRRDASWPEPASDDFPDHHTGGIPRQRTGDIPYDGAGDISYQNAGEEWTGGAANETWAEPHGYAYSADGNGYNGYAQNEAYAASAEQGGAQADGFDAFGNGAYPASQDGYSEGHDGGYSAGHDGGYSAGHDAFDRNDTYVPGGEGYDRDGDQYGQDAHAYGPEAGAYERDSGALGAEDAYARSRDAFGSQGGAYGHDEDAYRAQADEAGAYPRDGAGLEMSDGREGPGSEAYEQAGVDADPYGATGTGLGAPESDPWVGRAGAAAGGRLAEAETALFAGPWGEDGNGTVAGETAMIDLSTPRAEPRSHREGNRRRAGVVALAAMGVFLAGAAGYIVLRPDSSSSPTTAAVATSAPVETAAPTEDAPVAEPTTTAPSVSASPASTSASPTTAAPTTEAATTAPPVANAPATVKPSPTAPAARPTTASPAPTKTLVPAPTTTASAPLTAVYGFDNGGDGGYVGTVTVNNPNAAAVTDWQVRFTIPSGATITVLSGGVSASAGGSRVTFGGATVGARNSVTFTFGMESDGDDLPSGCTINGNACS